MNWTVIFGSFYYDGGGGGDDDDAWNGGYLYDDCNLHDAKMNVCYEDWNFHLPYREPNFVSFPCLPCVEICLSSNWFIKK